MDGMLPKSSRPIAREHFHGRTADYGGRQQSRKPLSDSLSQRLREHQSSVSEQPSYSAQHSAVDEPYDDPQPESITEDDSLFDLPVKPASKRQPRHVGSKIAVAVLVLATIGGAGFGGYKYFHKSSQHASGTGSGGATLGVTTEQVPPPELAQTTTQPSVAQLTTDADMATAINAVIAANPTYSIAVSVVPIKTGTTMNYGIDAVFDASGTGSLVTAATYLRQVEAGSLSMDKVIAGKTATEQLQLMIKDGNTDAWNAVTNDLGKPALQTLAQWVGMNTYTATNNRMKPQDLSLLLLQLYQGKITTGNKDKLLEYMQQANKTEYILQSLPTSGVKAYHKAGFTSDRSQDAAIIDNGTNPYVLVVFVKGADAAAETQRVDIIHKITKATIARFIDKNFQK